MILTKDNLVRYVREKKAVTPTMVAESFETSTMIASAALSEISKDKIIAITYLKLASSPYYYDPKQKSCLIELGEKHLSKHEKDIFLKLKEKEIIGDNSLSIQERLAIENIKDFAKILEINTGEKVMKFWVWFMRDLDETRRLISDALKSQNQPEKPVKIPKTPQQQNISQTNNSFVNEQREPIKNINTQQRYEQKTLTQPNYTQSHQISQYDENKTEKFIENFFRENYLGIESKNKEEKGIKYLLNLKLNRMAIYMDCFYYYKKPNESDIMKFYTSSIKPKIIFIENCPKKLLSLSDNLENLKIINI